ncbi:MAG: MarR family winged helix-turn-helix transcriptional regulator [Ktedonobacteraceae bacterium]
MSTDRGQMEQALHAHAYLVIVQETSQSQRQKKDVPRREAGGTEMAQQDLTKQPPLGYWLKHADEVITKHVNHVLSEQGFTRFHWQVLNSIYEAGTIARKDVFNAMQTFIEAHQFDDILDGFVKQGWLVERSDGDTTALMLTDAGKTKRDTIFKLQREVRRRAMRGITDQEYTVVLDVLQRMVNNLEKATPHNP